MAQGDSLPTMQDVARVAGVHRTTVSLALRNHPRIPKATRLRIQKIAGEMGYQTHPLVSALMTYRANRRKPNWSGTLALLTFGPERNAWLRAPAYGSIFEGITKRSQELGYEVSTLWMEEEGMTGKGMTKILRTRNTTGVIIPPLPNASNCREIRQINWNLFSSVTIGHTLRYPDIHRITNDYFHSLSIAFQRCVEIGYKRIGLVLPESADSRVDHLWLCSFLNEQRLHPKLVPVPPLIYNENQTQDSQFTAAMKWVNFHKPDVFMSLPSTLSKWKRQLGPFRIPKDIAWVNLGCYERHSVDSGIYPNYSKIGTITVDFIVAMIHRGERGIPEQSQTLQIKGIWFDGETTPLAQLSKHGKT